MKLNAEQRKKVEENMGLVGKVIKDKVHDVSRLGIYTYDDIYQIGSIGLCKAACTDKGGCFSTYAYRLIWNEICDALVYATRRSMTEQMTGDEISGPGNPHEEEEAERRIDLEAALHRARASATGVVAKGIEALQLKAQGYSSREIGDRMNATPNNVTAWISKARKALRAQPEFSDI
jgi:RNA polymerase sigma factor (sigma-70 family)